MFKKLCVVFMILAAGVSGCGEPIDFYESQPSIFDDESQQDTPSEDKKDSQSDKKKQSLFDYDEEEIQEDTEEYIPAETEIIPVENKTNPPVSETNNIPPASVLWRDNLSEQDRDSYDRMYNGIMSGSLDILLGKTYTKEELMYIYNCIKQDHPEIFWLDSYYSYTDSGIYFSFVNSINKDNLDEYRNRFEEKIKNILSLVPQDISKYEQIIFIHDYLVQNTEYATDYSSVPYEESQMYYNAYGCIVGNRSVCSGYTAAFQYLMHKIGVECGSVSGFQTSSGQSHIWNYVKYDGDYYWIDVTWDDPICLSDDSSSGTADISHKYFFITSEELLRNHTIVNENEKNLFAPECTSTKYNYMRYFGNFMEDYSFEEFDRRLSESNGKIAVQFGNKDAFVNAVTDLIYNKNISSTKYFSDNNISTYSYISDMEAYTIEFIIN